MRVYLLFFPFHFSKRVVAINDQRTRIINWVLNTLTGIILSVNRLNALRRGNNVQRFKEIFDENYPSLWSKFQAFGRDLQQKIGHNFTDEEKLWQALAIRGSKLPSDVFERLEFLGDGLLKAIHAILLYEKVESLSPEQLTLYRIGLENNDRLAQLLKQYNYDNLGKLLNIGKLSRDQSADCLEALIGALYLDVEKNFDTIKNMVPKITNFEKSLEEIMKSPWGAKDPKNVLQEWAQKEYHGKVDIQYPFENQGTSNAPQFIVHAALVEKSTKKLMEEGPKTDPFSKKKEGEIMAARLLLLKLKEEGKYKG